MSRPGRILDAVAALVACGIGVILATGGGTLAGVRLTRAEDLVVGLAAVVGLRLLVAPVRLPARRPGRIVAAAVGVYVALMGFVVLTRHAALRTHALDLGYYIQVVWSIANGHGARVTFPPMHAWGDHLSPVLYGFAALAWIFPIAPLLLVGQTLILALGAVALYRYAVLRLGEPAGGERLAAGLGVLYALNPSLHGINIRDVHPQAFAVPLLVAAALAYDRRRWGWCGAALVLTLMCREDAAIAVVGFGLWLAVARGRWGLGGAVAAASLALLVADVRWIMPYFRESPYPHLHRYAHLGGSLAQIVVGVVTDPGRWLGVVATLAKLKYLALLLLPLGLLPLGAPRVLVAALPGLAINLLALDPILVNHRSQYQAYVLPFLFLAAVDGCRALVGAERGGRGVVRATGGGLVTLGMILSVALTARTFNDLTITRWRLGPDQHAAYALMARVPPDASVTANDRLAPHLAERRQIYLAPSNIGDSEYLLERASEAPTAPEGYRLLRAAGDWRLYRR